jgi:hypothetical protein
MGRHISKNKLAGGVLLGAIASGALAVAAVSGAATANAGCVSINGQTTFFSGGGGDCSTNAPFSIAVANGTGTGAGTDGPGNIAIAAGTGTLSQAGGIGNFALANGNIGPNPGAPFAVPPFSYALPPNPNQQTFAQAFGVQNTAFAIGDGSSARAINFDSPSTTPGNNRATTIGNGSNSFAVSGNLYTTPIPAGQIANAIGNNVNSLNVP